MSNQRVIDTRRVRSNFSGHAHLYDRYAQVQKRVIDRLLELLAPHATPQGIVLEVGTGTGGLAQRLIECYPEVQPIISDLAHAMTGLAAQRLPKALALDADAQALPLISACCDQVVSTSVYQWVNDLPLAFCESARVLRPGGVFAFALFGERTLFELREAHRRAVLENGGRLTSHALNFPSEESCTAALSKAGLAPVLLLSEDEVEYHADVPMVLRSLKAIGASNAASDRPRGLASRRVMQRMVDLYETHHRQENGVPATYQVIYGIGRKAI